MFMFGNKWYFCSYTLLDWWMFKQPNLDDGTNDKFGAQAIEETDLSVFLTYEFVRPYKLSWV